MSNVKSVDKMSYTDLRAELEKTLKVGDKIYFVNENRPMVIKARTERYAIVTKPFNLQKTVLYSIIDFQNQKKAPNNMVFNSYDYKNQADIERCLLDLESGKIELSRRHGIDLDIDFERLRLPKSSYGELICMWMRESKKA